MEDVAGGKTKVVEWNSNDLKIRVEQYNEIGETENVWQFDTIFDAISKIISLWLAGKHGNIIIETGSKQGVQITVYVFPYNTKVRAKILKKELENEVIEVLKKVKKIVDECEVI